MAYIFRKITEKKFKWDPLDDKITLIKDSESTHVACYNLICRKSTAESYKKLNPLSIGSRNRRNDLERLYCTHFRNIDYRYKDQEPHIKKWINSTGLDEVILIKNQLISLLTGVPDFLVRSEKFNSALAYFQSSIDDAWDRWAKKSNNNHSRDILFEESVTVQKVDFRKHFSLLDPELRVIFDVSLGEFDRMNQYIDKIGVRVNVEVAKDFLIWGKHVWDNLDPKQKALKKQLLRMFSLQIAKQVEDKKEYFLIQPWAGDINNIIAIDILNQIQNISDKKIQANYGKFVSIPIEFRYGTFALKYFKYRFRSERGLPEIEF